MNTRTQTLRIGDIARRSGLTVDTIRYYEREGLLGRVPRRPSGLREFGPDIVTRLAFIRQTASLGFSLTEIRELLALRVSAQTTCDEVERRARAKLDAVKARIAELDGVRAALDRVITACASAARQCPCPFLNVLDAQATLATKAKG